MEFRETLLAAQRNQQQKSSDNSYYKARFDPPKKEQKQKDRLSANIQKFLAKKDEEEKQKKLEAQRKREELSAMRDPKALRKIQKTLKVIKSANKSVLQDAVDRDNTAVTLTGPEQPDQDDYGYESQEAAAIYAKMMQKYSKIPDEPKFPTANQTVKRDLKGTMERVKQALQHEDDPVPHKRKRKTDGTREDSPPLKYEPEKKEENKKPDKPKIRKPMPPPMDFNQLLKLAEQKKSEPVEVAAKKIVTEAETERPMTKRQKREYEEEMARRQRRQERLDAEKNGKKPHKEERPVEKERKQEPSGIGRIPKVNDNGRVPKLNDNGRIPKLNDNGRIPKLNDNGRIPKLNDKNPDRNHSPKLSERNDKDREKLLKEKERARIEREILEREKEKLRLERERIDRDLERLNKDRERLDKTKAKLENGRSDRISDRPKTNPSEAKKIIDLKSQNTYRIDKNSNDKKLGSKNEERQMNGHSSQGSKVVPKLSKEQILKNGLKDKALLMKQKAIENGKRSLDSKVPFKRPDDRPGSQAGPSKPKVPSNTFDFDKHVNSLKKGSDSKNGIRPGEVKRKPHPDDKRKPTRRVVPSDSEYDSEMDDFIDDGDENMDYSKHIKEIFGYDRSRYRDIDDDDDPNMESSFARQQREEFISKKIGIMEDLEDMKMEAMQKKKSKKRRISDD